MIRRVVGPIVAAMALSGTAVANAEASPLPCSFTLATPQVVQVSGVNMVTVTVAPVACNVPASPTMSVACLQIRNSESAEQCASAQGLETAQAYAPYRSGATYIGTGRGCASTGNPPRSICQTTGPLTATL